MLGFARHVGCEAWDVPGVRAGLRMTAVALEQRCCSCLVMLLVCKLSCFLNGLRGGPWGCIGDSYWELDSSCFVVSTKELAKLDGKLNLSFKTR
ncbi:hypothetical protein Taro_039039, partial [Colocasia esculenta]|nr:hypothetical protein [Colocasia esculenta]